MGELSDDARRRQEVLRRLFIATALCSFFLVVEVVGGLLAGSLAILSDAAHLFADLASFSVASKCILSELLYFRRDRLTSSFFLF